MDLDMGPLAVPSWDQVMLPWFRHHGSWEVDESAVVMDALRPGATFIDIGAHVGYYTIKASAVVGRGGTVIAIEADAENRAALTYNVVAHRCRNVHIMAGAAWEDTRPVVLRRSAVNTGDHRIRVDGAGPVVPGVALDEALPEDLPITVIKSDLQGVDHVALRGLRRTLARWRPLVVVEYWPPGMDERDAETVPDEYRALGYEVAALEAPWLPDDADGPDYVAAAAASDHGFLTLVLRPRG